MCGLAGSELTKKISRLAISWQEKLASANLCYASLFRAVADFLLWTTGKVVCARLSDSWSKGLIPWRSAAGKK